MNCPVCACATEIRRLKGGSFRRCERCGGNWIALSVMRQAGQRPLAAAFWERIKATPAGQRSDRACGSCGQRMLALNGKPDGPSACRSCQMIWISQEDIRMPEGRRVDYQLNPDDAARLEQESFAHVPDKAAESEPFFGNWEEALLDALTDR